MYEWVQRSTLRQPPLTISTRVDLNRENLPRLNVSFRPSVIARIRWQDTGSVVVYALQSRVTRSFPFVCAVAVKLHTISVTNTSEVRARVCVCVVVFFVWNGPGQDTSAQLQMCHRQDRRQFQNDRRRTYKSTTRGEGETRGEKIPRHIDCIPTSSVRLVVRYNGGTDKALFVGERDCLQREGTWTVFFLQ